MLSLTLDSLQITRVKVLVSPVDMETQSRAFGGRMTLWDNVVAIGCKNGSVIPFSCQFL